MREDPPRVWAGPEVLGGRATPLLSRYLLHTLKLSAGDVACLVCGDGHLYRVRLRDVDPRATRLEVLDRVVADTDPRTAVTLYVGALKGDQMTYVVQQLTELGVQAIVPMETERSFRRLPFRSHAHWQQTSWDSAVLCGRTGPADIHPGLTFAEALQTATGLRLLCCERRPDLPAAHTLLRPGPVAIFVGPEAGFSPAEMEAAATAGVHCCTLGPRMLRALTVAMAATTLALSAAEELG